MFDVSILTGSEEPVQLLWRRNRQANCLFQSSPAPKSRCNITWTTPLGTMPTRFNPHRLRRAGATRGRKVDKGPVGSFNPHRLRRAGATVSRRDGRVAAVCFNPHRLRRAGATGCPVSAVGCSTVSILTGSEEPVQQIHSGAGAAATPVSILTGSEEPVQQWIDRSHYIAAVFQSSPAPKSRCNSYDFHGLKAQPWFQSSPAPKSRCNMLSRSSRRPK